MAEENRDQHSKVKANPRAPPKPVALSFSFLLLFNSCCKPTVGTMHIGGRSSFLCLLAYDSVIHGHTQNSTDWLGSFYSNHTDIEINDENNVVQLLFLGGIYYISES